ncbi:MAG: MptD family putative ECF transporter S component [Propionibacteriaceae bacterium]|nr:MptD family putative ECF transporter S component [Propionibacteriaceae bacterium]
MSTTVEAVAPSVFARLAVKDLITVGIFSAFYIAVFYVVGMLGIIPVVMVLLPLLLPIVTGIPFLLYLTRVRKFGMISITGVLVALVMAMGGGHAWALLAIVPACGVAADLILASGRYASWWRSLLGFFVFSLWVFGPMLPLLLADQAYLAMVSESYGPEYTAGVTALMPSWYWLTMPVQTAAGTLIGGYLGRATLRKHFERAGIA